MKSRLPLILFKAIIGHMPARWFRASQREGKPDMGAIAIPTYRAETARAFAQRLAEAPAYKVPVGGDAGKLEREAERLQLEVKAATVRNTSAVASGETQAQHIKSFEERARDTLRDLLDTMDKGQ